MAQSGIYEGSSVILLENWGEPQLRAYERALLTTFEAIASGLISGSFFSDRLPNVQVVKSRQHYVFYIKEGRPRLLVVAVLHKKQDLLAGIVDRL